MANFTATGEINANRAAAAYQELSTMVEGRDYNLGELILDKSGNLTKVNHHASGFFANDRITLKAENENVRKAVTAAIRQHWAGEIGERRDLLDKISNQLTGDEFKSLPLTRREVCAYLKLMKGEILPQDAGADRCIDEIHKAEHGTFGYYRDALNKFKLSKYSPERYTMNSNMLRSRDALNRYSQFQLALHLGGIMKTIREVAKMPLSRVEACNERSVKEGMGKLIEAMRDLETMRDAEACGQNVDKKRMQELMGKITDVAVKALAERGHYHQLTGNRDQQLKQMQRFQSEQGWGGIHDYRQISPDGWMEGMLDKVGRDVRLQVDDVLPQMSGKIDKLAKYLNVNKGRCERMILGDTGQRILNEFVKLKSEIGKQLLFFIERNKIDDCDESAQVQWLNNGVIGDFDGFLADMTQKINEFTDKANSFGELDDQGIQTTLANIVLGQHKKNVTTISRKPPQEQKELMKKEIEILNEFGVSADFAKESVKKASRVLGESGDERELTMEDDLAKKFNGVLNLQGNAGDAYFSKLASKLSNEYKHTLKSKNDESSDVLSADDVKSILTNNFENMTVGDLKIQIRENLESIRQRLGDAMVKAGVDFDLLLEHVDVGYLMAADTTLGVLKDSILNMADEIRKKIDQEPPVPEDLVEADKMITALEQMKDRFDKVAKMSEGVTIPERTDHANPGGEEDLGEKYKLTEKLTPAIDGLFAKNSGLGRIEGGNHQFAGKDLYKEVLVVGKSVSKGGGATEDLGEVYRQMRKDAKKYISGVTGKSVYEQKAIVNDFIVNQIDKLKKMQGFLYVFAKDADLDKGDKVDLVKLRQDLNRKGGGVRRENVTWKHQDGWNAYMADIDAFARHQLGKGLSGEIEGVDVDELKNVGYDFTTDWD